MRGSVQSWGRRKLWGDRTPEHTLCSHCLWGGAQGGRGPGPPSCHLQGQGITPPWPALPPVISTVVLPCMAWAQEFKGETGHESCAALVSKGPGTLSLCRHQPVETFASRWEESPRLSPDRGFGDGSWKGWRPQVSEVPHSLSLPGRCFKALPDTWPSPKS